jgi:hypothetical protein
MDLERSAILEAFKKGSYYAPATDHYGGSKGRVYCDRCTPTISEVYPPSADKILKVCIGYKDVDLCMLCVHELSQIIKLSEIPIVIRKGLLDLSGMNICDN